MTEEQNINQLPEGWKWVKLRDISESIQYGYTESSSKELIGPKFLRITDIQDNKVLWNEVPYCKIEEETKKKYLLKDGDLVFARTGATVGKSFLLKGNIPESVFASYLIRVRVNNEINEQYLSNFFHSTIYWSQITEGQVGIGQPNVNGTKLGQLNLPLPPKPAQQAIVSKIEELFSELDKGIEQLKTAQQQLKTYRQSVLKWAFEGKLTEEWREQLGSRIRIRSRSQIELGSKVRIPAGSFNDTMAAEAEIIYGKNNNLPMGWKWVKLSDVAEKITDGEHFRPPTQESGIPFLSAKDIRDEGVSFNEPLFISEETAKKALQRCNPKRGDILIVSRGATVGRMCIVKTDQTFCLLGSVILIKVNKSISSGFINYVLKSPLANQKMITVSGATAQQAIYLRDIKDIEIPLCPIEEQNNIVQEIESRLSVADKMEESINQSLQQAEALRQSILKKAFEGRLVANDTIETIKQTAKTIPFERKVLAGKIIQLLHDDYHFGLTKFQKIFYLVENFAEVPYETNFIQERAGPYDKEFTMAFRKEMQEMDWANEEQKGSITKFIPAENIGSLISNYPTYFRGKGSQITFVLRQLKDKSTHEAELIATLYAVWNNRLIKKKPIKIEVLLEEFFNWSAKKKEEFHEDEVTKTYEWMKEIKLLPKGFGTVIESTKA